MEQFMAYLDEKAALYRQESRRLTADDRRDEGDLAKIRANVYGICKSVFQVLDAERAAAKLTGCTTNGRRPLLRPVLTAMRKRLRSRKSSWKC